jgi:hypothetical protein
MPAIQATKLVRKIARRQWYPRLRVENRQPEFEGSLKSLGRDRWCLNRQISSPP